MNTVYKYAELQSYTYHSDTVVEQRFTEDDDVEQLIDVDRLKDSEYSDWVDGGQ